MKYQIRDGNTTSMNGRIDAAMKIPPVMRKEHIQKLYNVSGNWSLLMPASALNLFRVIPREFVSKNS